MDSPLAFGFDLDHTLVRYRLPATYELIHTCLTRYLCNVKGYAASVAATPLDHAFVCKGIVLDLKTGDFLKLDERGVVRRARHGVRSGWMSPEACARAYGDAPWPGAGELQGRGHFFAFTTYFDIPAMHVCAMLIDLADAAGGVYDFMGDVFDAFDFIFNPEALHEQRGGYFSTIMANPELYLFKREPVKEWLVQQRERGVDLFLVTNSHVNYSEVLMRFSFGNEWRSLFSIVVFRGRKHVSGSGFFCTLEDAAARPFYRTEAFEDILAESTNCQGSPVESLAELLIPGRGYIGGNCHHVIDAIAIGHDEGWRANVLVAYFGDHMLGDMLPPPMYGGARWKAVGIVEEMTDQRSMDNGNEQSWGSFFTCGVGIGSAVPSYWAALVETTCCVATDDLASLDINFELPARFAYTPSVDLARLLTVVAASVPSPIASSTAGWSWPRARLVVAVCTVAAAGAVYAVVVRKRGL